jgi:hypothetical protein
MTVDHEAKCGRTAPSYRWIKNVRARGLGSASHRARGTAAEATNSRHGLIEHPDPTTKQVAGADIAVPTCSAAPRLEGRVAAPIWTPTPTPIAANTNSSPSLRFTMLASTTTDSAFHHGARISPTGALPLG